MEFYLEVSSLWRWVLPGGESCLEVNSSWRWVLHGSAMSFEAFRGMVGLWTFWLKGVATVVPGAPSVGDNSGFREGCVWVLFLPLRAHVTVGDCLISLSLQV